MITARTKRKVLVLGAGVAGLAAARHLHRQGVDVTVLEREDHPGGRAHTEKVDGYAIDVAAGFLGSFYTHTLRLVDELGLERVPIHGKGAVFRDGRVHPIRLGPGGTLTSPASRWRLAKVVFEVLRHWRRLDVHALEKAHELDTESVTAYARRALGDELLEYLLEPTLSGLCYWSPDTTSSAMLLLMLKAALRLRRSTLHDGIGELPRRMANGLDLRLGAEVSRVTGDLQRGYEVAAEVNGKERSFRADGVVCATPAGVIPSVFPDLPERQRSFFRQTSYSATVAVALALEQRSANGPGSVFFPRVEAKARYLAAVSSLAAKNPAQVPPGRELLRLFATGSAAHGLMKRSDSEIRDALVLDLERAGLGSLTASEELFHRVYRWPLAVPEFDVGSLKRLEEIAESDGMWGHVAFAGDYLGGPSIEGAVTSGLRAARRLAARLAGNA